MVRWILAGCGAEPHIKIYTTLIYMKKIFGSLTGLKPNQIKSLERLYGRRVNPSFMLTPELAREMLLLSLELRRQLGVLLDRKGYVNFVILGDAHGIEIPDISDYRTASQRLCGLRCIHTHLEDQSLSDEDLTDLALLRLDLMAVITPSRYGEVQRVHWAHVAMDAHGGPYTVETPLLVNQLDIDCADLIAHWERGLAGMDKAGVRNKGYTKAYLVNIIDHDVKYARTSLAELRELAASNEIEVVGVMQQHIRDRKQQPLLLGSGKLRELAIAALQQHTDLVIFNCDLSPAQIRNITDQISLRVIDRTQLILDIFAKRARTREGKLQVELAQLKYLLPRLSGQTSAFSRLAGGIGGRGPGETRLEIDRRRARERIHKIEGELKGVRKIRQTQRSQRNRDNLPVISIVGYTNAGKSTLLNTLTQSHILAEDKLFATLDPTSRRLRLPRETDVIITDTVGFIQDLPDDLVTAFQATLEELQEADILLHVIDVSDTDYLDEKIAVVESVLADLELQGRKTVRVLNKVDLVPQEKISALVAQYGGIAVTAKNRQSLLPLVAEVERLLEL